MSGSTSDSCSLKKTQEDRLLLPKLTARLPKSWTATCSLVRTKAVPSPRATPVRSEGPMLFPVPAIMVVILATEESGSGRGNPSLQLIGQLRVIPCSGTLKCSIQNKVLPAVLKSTKSEPFPCSAYSIGV